MAKLRHARCYTDQTAEVSAKIGALGEDELRDYLRLYQAYLELFKKTARTAVTAEDCADTILRVLDSRRPRTRYLVGIDANLLVRLANWLPDRALDWIFRKML